MTVDAPASRTDDNPSQDQSRERSDAALRDRQTWMSVLAKAKPGALATKLAKLKNVGRDLPSYSVIRPAESGAVMVRGRAGGTGSPFNLGEVSVTRCVVQLTGNGEGSIVGHAYVAGRDKRHAEDAALLDALMQTKRWATTVRETVIQPLARDAAAARQDRSGKVAATKVNFFTMVRGEN